MPPYLDRKTEPFDLGGALVRAVTLPVATPGAVLTGLLLSAVLTAINWGALTLFAIQVYQHHDYVPMSQIAAWSLLLPIPFTALLVAAVLQPMMTRAALRERGDPKPAFGESLRMAAGGSIRALPVQFVTWLVKTVMTLLLVAPGVYTALGWYVATPAAIAERLNPLEAVEKSAALSQGNRARLFVFMALCSLVVAAVLVAATVAAGAVANSPLQNGRDAKLGVYLPAIVAIWALHAVSLAVLSIVSACGPAAAYAELIRLRRGRLGNVAEVFS